MSAHSKSIVRLDVGGKKFTTAISTLTREPESMLAKLVSDQWLQPELSSLCQNGSGKPDESKNSKEIPEIFIDR